MKLENVYKKENLIAFKLTSSRDNFDEFRELIDWHVEPVTDNNGNIQFISCGNKITAYIGDLLIIEDGHVVDVVMDSQFDKKYGITDEHS